MSRRGRLEPSTTRRGQVVPTAPRKITILLVDDHELVRRGLRALLETEDDLVVVGEAQDGRPCAWPASCDPTSF